MHKTTLYGDLAAKLADLCSQGKQTEFQEDEDLSTFPEQMDDDDDVPHSVM